MNCAGSMAGVLVKRVIVPERISCATIGNVMPPWMFLHQNRGSNMMATTKSLYLLVLLGAGNILAASAAEEVPAQSFTEAHKRATVTILHGTESVLGKPLIGTAGERAGLIVDVVADANGQVRAAIVDFGGFMGIGSRKIAVDWSDLKFEGSEVRVDLTRDRLSRAPEVKEGHPVLAVTARPPRDRAAASDQIRSP